MLSQYPCGVKIIDTRNPAFKYSINLKGERVYAPKLGMSWDFDDFKGIVENPQSDFLNLLKVAPEVKAVDVNGFEVKKIAQKEHLCYWSFWRKTASGKEEIYFVLKPFEGASCSYPIPESVDCFLGIYPESEESSP